MTAVTESGSFAVWDSGGALVRKVSREGQGPGELRGRPTLMVDAWDSIHARDEDMRWSTFSPELEYVRGADGGLLVHPRHVAFLGNGSVVSAFNPAATDGTLFRVLDRQTGKELRAFGAAEPDERRPRRIVAPATDTTFWAMPQHRLKIQEWSTSGRLVRTYEPAGPWMARDGDDFWAGEGTPLPVLTSLAFDAENGLLWVRGMVPDPRTFDHSREFDMDDVSGLYDFVLQVIDADSGRTIAMHRERQLDQSVSDFLGAGLAFREVEGQFGLKRYDILRMWLMPNS